MPSPRDFTASSWNRSVAHSVDFAFAVAALLPMWGVAELAGVSLNPGVWFGVGILSYQFYFLSGRGGATLGKTSRNICVISENGGSLSNAQACVRAILTALPYTCIIAGADDGIPVAQRLSPAIPTFGVAYIFLELLLLGQR
jgi:uncharacterized RDD family membrane protein YckC